MAREQVPSDIVSALLSGIAAMLEAGIQVDEAVALLAEDTQDQTSEQALAQAYELLSEGESLSSALDATGVFPTLVISTLTAGEQAGRLQQVLESLAAYYAEETRLFDKVRMSVGYPAAMLLVLSVAVAFCVLVVLPAFSNVYVGLTAGLTAASLASLSASNVIGYVALALTVVAAILALIAVVLSRTQAGRMRLLQIFAHVPALKPALYELALSRFLGVLAVQSAAGTNDDDAVREAAKTVENPELQAKIAQVQTLMGDLKDPHGLVQAIAKADVLLPVYARLLEVGTRSGSLEASLEELGDLLFDESIERLDSALDHAEPLLTALVTIAVGATLVAVMLPLIGVLGSVG